MPVRVARLNTSARHIRAIVPALSPRDAPTETPIPLRRGLFWLIHKNFLTNTQLVTMNTTFLQPHTTPGSCPRRRP